MTTSEMLETWRIARIGAARSAECASLHAASFAAAWEPADFARFLAAGEIIAHGAIATASDRLAGMVLSRVALDEAEVLTVAVEPAQRRRGLARRLFMAHLEALAEAGVTSLFLEVEAGNAPARALYEALGFAVVGERKAYYLAGRPGPAAALVLRRNLAGHEACT